MAERLAGLGTRCGGVGARGGGSDAYMVALAASPRGQREPGEKFTVSTE
jgi:hypothetical protein